MEDLYTDSDRSRTSENSLLLYILPDQYLSSLLVSFVGTHLVMSFPVCVIQIPELELESQISTKELLHGQRDVGPYVGEESGTEEVREVRFV